MGITKARELKNWLVKMEYLDRVSQIAYGLDIPGLTQDECTRLEMLCDKATDGIEAEIENNFNL